MYDGLLTAMDRRDSDEKDARISALTAEVHGLQERLDTANECIALLNTQRDKARDDSSALTAENERITDDRDAWREQHNNLVACFQTEQKNLGAKIDTLELQLIVSEKGRICAIEDKQGFIEDWKRLTAENERLREDKERLVTARPFEEWHEDIGDVLWWHFPICEPPYVGTPLDKSFLWLDDERPYRTHWTPLPNCNEIQERFDAAKERP